MSELVHSPEFYLVPSGVVITSRHAYLLHKRTNIDNLRIRGRGLDPEFAGVLLALRKLAMSYAEGSVEVPRMGSDIFPIAEPAGQLSSEQVADRLGISSRAVTKAIASGALLAVKSKGRWLIERSDLEQYEADRREKAKR